MNSGKYVFSQLLEFVNRYEFDRCVKLYSGNYRVRHLNCWNQFIQLFFGQLTSLNSLQGICLCLKTHKKKLLHLGIKQNVAVSTLSRANEKRDWRIFAEFANYLILLVRPLYCECDIPKVDIDNEVFALDSTTISVSINLCTWAQGKYSRGAVKMHTLLNLRGSIPEFVLITDGKYHDSNALDMIIPQPQAIYLMDKAYVDFEALFRINQAEAFFVTRAKTSQRYAVIEQNFNIDQDKGLRADKTIMLVVTKSKKLYPEELRLVEFYDSQNDELIVFLTNNFNVSALEVVNLYKNRWQIEVFFKWIKQNLVIKKLWDYSPNAVRIHIWIAIFTYLIIAYVKVSLESKLSIYEIMQVLGISAFDKTPIRDLLLEQCQFNQNVNEQLNLFE
ncbi:MAG: IS4 family transposase [Paludibacter sp.]|nr:IS4 family transposase [Paludibacter sp.]MDD4429078.1 IS4 family transposase [Paludibacter sp.]